jgi:GntR family transcriptional repressor for pyruvate dehydrogenase complex
MVKPHVSQLGWARLAASEEKRGNIGPFSPARRVRSLDDVVMQIRNAILSGQIAEGERLPSERDLCAALGVGRPTLREALRSLEALGILEIRPGKGGGAYAVRPSESTLGAALATLVSLRGATAQELAEFRLSFEAENAWWAAQRADATDIAKLEALVAETRHLVEVGSGDWGPLAEADARWHEAVARATKNRLRIGISLGLHEPVLRQLPALSAGVDRYSRSIPRALAKITKAIAVHDADGARDAMRAHIEQWNRLNRDVPGADAA